MSLERLAWAAGPAMQPAESQADSRGVRVLTDGEGQVHFLRVDCTLWILSVLCTSQAPPQALKFRHGPGVRPSRHFLGGWCCFFLGVR